ncbi:MAG: histidine kinase dimerization/phosphoacceptor domain-containing protein [Pseudomonadales bacterium]|nr:histidine kinase dimerization/phosphoacceptor domain-containing protein [Pseudomonadales bacterium]
MYSSHVNSIPHKAPKADSKKLSKLELSRVTKRLVIAPQMVVLIISFLALLISYSSAQYLLDQPFYHLGINVVSDRIYLNGDDKTELLGLDSGQGFINIVPEDIAADPDFITSFKALRDYYKKQQLLYDALSKESVSFLARDRTGEHFIRYKKRATLLSDLPITFWLLQCFAVVALLTGLSFWAYHRDLAVTRILAIGGVGCYLMQTSMAVFASRQIALDGLDFLWLLRINHFGGFMFAVSLVMLLWFYPKPVGSFKLAMIVPTGAFVTWLNEIFEWIEWPLSLFYFPALILLVLASVLLWLQWKSCLQERKLALLLLWLIYTVLGGLGFIFTTYVVPMIFIGQPLMNTWIANFCCLLIYLGFVLGVHFGGLFAVERWWLKAFGNVMIAVLFIFFDLVAITLIGIETAFGFSLLAVLCFWIYLSGREWLRQWLLGDSHNKQALAKLLLRTEFKDYQKGGQKHQWESELLYLKRLYRPISLNTVECYYASPKILNKGVKLGFSVPKNDSGEFKSFELIGKLNGQQLYTQEDGQNLHDFIQHSFEVKQLHAIRETVLLEERQRIMRDLHDDVAGDLLALSYQLEKENDRQLVQKCLKNLREIVYSMEEDKTRSLWNATAGWRFEMSQLLEPLSVKLLWQDEVATDCTLNGSQWLNLSR